MAGVPQQSPGDAGIREAPGEAPAAVPALEGSPQTYRPLSLLAILALVLSALYALIVLVGGLIPFARSYPRSFFLLLPLGPVAGLLAAALTRQKGGRIASFAGLGLGGVVVLVGLGGLVAFSGSAPWMLGEWTWALLGAAVLVAFISLSRVRAAEGALAGLELSRWALYLALFFGGYYLLYYSGNRFAVSAQAEAVADRFVEHLRKGEMHQAFYETLKPGDRPGAGPDLQAEIETTHDVPRGGPEQAGDFTAFRTSDFVQRIRLGGESTLKRRSSSTEYASAGYKAELVYDLTNDFGHFELRFEAQAVDSAGVRQWHVVSPSCRITRMYDKTEKGDRVERATYLSRAALEDWVRDVTRGNRGRAYLLTLPPEKRSSLLPSFLLGRPEAPAWAGLAPAGVLAGRPAEAAEIADGVRAFGERTVLPSRTFLRNNPKGEDMLREVRDLLDGRSRTAVELHVVRVRVPDIREEGGEIEVARPLRVLVLDQGGRRPKYALEVEALLRANLAAEADRDRGFRVAALRVTRPTHLPPPPGSPQGQP